MISGMPSWLREWASAYQKPWLEFWRPVNEKMFGGVPDRSSSTPETLVIAGSLILGTTWGQSLISD